MKKKKAAKAPIHIGRGKKGGTPPSLHRRFSLFPHLVEEEEEYYSGMVAPPPFSLADLERTPPPWGARKEGAACAEGKKLEAPPSLSASKKNRVSFLHLSCAEKRVLYSSPYFFFFALVQ